MNRPILHLISQAHLDPVWLWPVRDGIAETLTTLQSAVDRAAENPDFTFTRSSSCTYQWAKEMDPVLYESIRDLVKQGRWEVVGGWIEQPDCNLPSAESFIRQGLYGKAFFEREFGSAGRTGIGYNPDSFGHCGGLPQLLAHTDFDGYAFMRPQPHDNPDLPLLFWWESQDGSRVLGCRIPTQYSQSYAANADDIERSIRHAAEHNFVDGFDHAPQWFGVGNHGGGPTREHIARIKELQQDDSLPEIRFSSVRNFMEAVRQSPAAKDLKVVRNELGYVLRGCYSATGEVKQLHRFSEKALYAAESLDVLANGSSADPTVLADAWWKLLFNEFHDILAGTCTPNCQAETRQRFGSTLDSARDQRMKAAFRMARRVDTRTEKGSVLFAANPLPWPRTAVVQLDCFMQPHGREDITHLETRDGQEITIQWATADANFGPWGLKWGKLTAAVDLPAGGYQTFRVATRPLAQAVKAHDPAADEENAQLAKFEEEDIRIDTTRDPALSRWTHDILGELLSAEVGTVVIEDKENTWGFGVDQYATELGRPGIVETETLEEGPVLKIVRQKTKWQSSEIWMDVVTTAHSPAIELRFRINWQEKRQILKLDLPTRLTDSQLRVKMPAETVARPADGLEYPCHDWIALSGQLDGREAAIGLINDSSYSYDATDGRLRMILTRGCALAEHPPFEYKDERNIPFLDQGWQERRFLLVAGEGLEDLHLDRLAQEFQIPAESMFDNGHPGTEPWQASFLSVEPATVEVLALKAAEDGNGTLLRLRETTGEPVNAKVHFQGKDSQLPLQPFELASFRFPANGSPAERVNGLECG
jgi:alpha-mannosidase